MASAVPNIGLPQDGFDWSNDDVRVLLVNGTHVYNPDNVFVADIVADEIAAAGYTRKAISGKSVVVNSPSNQREMRGNPTVWSSASFGTVGGAYVYNNVGTDATRVLRAFIEGPVVSAGRDFRVASSGVYIISKECAP